MGNVYFDLTREFNAKGTIAVLTSGQAVVYYRVAMMSKDGDWVLRETNEACERILDVLAARDARYRPCAPLHPRWLSGGWSSHFEFLDPAGRRVRCDFLTRPPRVSAAVLARLFEDAPVTDAPEADNGIGDAPRAEGLRVLDLESLILTKRTQRAKDYPIVGELARLLPPEKEIEHTTDPDRLLELALLHGAESRRPPVRAALEGRGRDAVVVALARELDAFQREDRERLERYERASERFLERFHREGLGALSLREAHEKVVRLAEESLLPDPLGLSSGGRP